MYKRPILSLYEQSIFPEHTQFPQSSSSFSFSSNSTSVTLSPLLSPSFSKSLYLNHVSTLLSLPFRSRFPPARNPSTAFHLPHNQNKTKRTTYLPPSTRSFATSSLVRPSDSMSLIRCKVASRWSEKPGSEQIERKARCIGTLSARTFAVEVIVKRLM